MWISYAFTYLDKEHTDSLCNYHCLLKVRPPTFIDQEGFMPVEERINQLLAVYRRKAEEGLNERLFDYAKYVRELDKWFKEELDLIVKGKPESM